MLKEVAIVNNPFWNIWDAGTQYKVRLSVPDLYKKNITVEVIEGNFLTVSSKNEIKTKKEGKNYIVREYSYDSWSKSIYLPKNVLADSVKVKYKEGVLKITIDKQIDTK